MFLSSFSHKIAPASSHFQQNFPGDFLFSRGMVRHRAGLFLLIYRKSFGTKEEFYALGTDKIPAGVALEAGGGGSGKPDGASHALWRACFFLNQNH